MFLKLRGVRGENRGEKIKKFMIVLKTQKCVFFVII